METDKETAASSSRADGSIFYGWWVVAAVSGLYLVASGIYWSGFSFYFLPITRDLGLSYTSMSLALGLARLVGGLQGPVAGYLVDRLGPRLMILLGGAMGGAGFILLALTHSYLTLLLVYLGLIALGFSGGFDQGIMAVANRWFVRRKAQAMSFLFVGLSLGSAFVTPVIGLLVVNLGWRETATISGVAILVLLAPALILIRNSPEEMKLTPDGQPSRATGPEAPSDTGPASGPASSQADFTARQGFRTTSYWVLSLSMGLRIAAYTGLLAHFVPIMVWKGQPETVAALLIGIYGLVAIPLRLIMGWMGDRWPKQKVSSWGMLLGGLSIALLSFSKGQLWQLVVVVVLLAVADSTSVVAWALVGDLFGRRAFATLLGGMTMVYSLMSAIMPILAGWVFDTSGSYLGAMLLFTILFTTAGFLFWNIPRPRLPNIPASGSLPQPLPSV